MDVKLVDGTLYIKQQSRVHFVVLAKEMGSKILVYGRALHLLVQNLALHSPLLTSCVVWQTISTCKV